LGESSLIITALAMVVLVVLVVTISMTTKARKNRAEQTNHTKDCISILKIQQMISLTFHAAQQYI